MTLATMTKDPTPNITIKFNFFRRPRLSLQSVGIGMHRIMMSWVMLIPAAIYTAAKTLIHWTGGVLYIQFVQTP